MAGIGADIAEVMAELGDTATVFRTPSNLTEKISLETNWSANSVFVRDFYLGASLGFDTVIVPGDVLQIKGHIYLVADRIADTFEDEIVEYTAGLYRCNIASTAKFLRPVNAVHATTFVSSLTWATQKDNAYCVVYKDARTAVNNMESSTGKDTVFSLDCFVPKSYGIKKGDRLYITATEYYRVQDVEPYAFTGIDILALVEDERVVYTP